MGSNYSPKSDEPFKLMALPWPSNSLSPFLSKDAIQAHYDNFYKSYIRKMNAFASQYPELSSMNLSSIVQKYSGKIQDTAAQILNHNFFWRVLSPRKQTPSARTYQLIEQQFGSYDNFMIQFNQKVIDHFGSGWIWLVYNDQTQQLIIVEGHDAYNPILDGYIPLITLDVWEHSYYRDYVNDKKLYAERFWNFINWEYVESIIQERIGGYAYGEVLV